MKKFKRVLVAGMATTMLLGSALSLSAAGLKDIFDAKYYADSYADLKAAFGYDESLLYNHFLAYGLKEGRNMSPILNVAAYRRAYGDLNTAFGNDWDAYVNHFIAYGAGEMRDMGVLFNPVIYADAYADIKAAYGDDLLAIIRHYLTFGKAENRAIGTSDGYADMAAARRAEEEAWQVNPSDTGKTDTLSVIWNYNGRVEYEYDKRGNCISLTFYDLEGNKKWIYHFTFNSNDELVYREAIDAEGNCDGYDKYEYDGGKTQKITYYTGSGEVSFCERYEWNGNKVKISQYNETGNLILYSECETDSRLNFTREDHYTKEGELYAFYVYTYDENDNVLTKIGYTADGTEVSNGSFTYYENGTKKTETNIMGSEKELFKYNENGSRASREFYVYGVLQDTDIYDYYAEGPLATQSSDRYYSGGSSAHDEVDYDRQGRKQKKTYIYEDSDGSSTTSVTEYAADGSYTFSQKKYASDGKLKSKQNETFNAQDKQVSGTYYTFSDGNVVSVTVDAYENGRIVRTSVYGADEVTLVSATVYTYTDAEYGYDKIIKELDANGDVVSTNTYMCDENGDHLGWRMAASDGGFVAYWHKGKYKQQRWYYTAEGKLCRKEIQDPDNPYVITAVYEYDDDGNEIALVQTADGQWVRPSDSSVTG